MRSPGKRTTVPEGSSRHLGLSVMKSSMIPSYSQVVQLSRCMAPSPARREAASNRYEREPKFPFPHEEEENFPKAQASTGGEGHKGSYDAGSGPRKYRSLRSKEDQRQAARSSITNTTHLA